MINTKELKDFSVLMNAAGMERFLSLAVQAPDEIPAWFRCTFSERPSVRPSPVVWFNGIYNIYAPFITQFFDHQNLVWSFWDEEVGEMRAPTLDEVPLEIRSVVDSYVHAYELDVQSEIKWEMDQQENRYFQWRMYYAERMLSYSDGSLYKKNPVK